MTGFQSRLKRAVSSWSGETIALAVLLAVPLAIATSGSYRMYLSSEMVMYAGAAVGLTVLLGVAKQFHLGQSAFMAMGAYAGAIIAMHHSDSLPKELAVGMLAGAVLGCLVGVATLRLRGLYFALATLALVLGIESLAGNWDSLTNGQAGLTSIPGVVIWHGSHPLSGSHTYMLIAALFLIEGAVVFALKRSTYWGALKLIGDRDYLASCIGIPVLRYRIVAFVTVGMSGAVWGVFYAHLVGYIDPTTFGLALTVPLLMMVVLGGLGSFWGALAGAVILVQIPEWLSSLQSQEQLVYGGILLAVILLFPKGVLPSLFDLYQKHGSRVRVALRRGDPAAQRQRARDNARLMASELSFDGATLRVTNLAVSFGGVHALRGVDLAAAAGQIEGVIGPNGSGKTTMLNSISGIVHPDSGSVLLDDEEIVGRPPHKIAQLGLLRTFQTPQVVLDMTALDNAVIGWHQRRKTGVLSVALRLPRARREEARQLEEARKMCAELDIDDVLDLPAAELSTGDRRFVELARALGSRPRILFLDEPATGMTGLERERLMIVLDRLRKCGLTIIVIDHDMEFLFKMADHVTVLDSGRNIAEGIPSEVRNAPQVVEAYFGKPTTHA
jgi:branched-chain amino acid transport system permease protein